MKQGIIYMRVSSSGSLESRQNTGRQKEELMKYAMDHEIEVVRSYEEHISGHARNKDRGVLYEAFNYAITNSVELILFNAFDRLGRSVLEVQESVKFMVDNHINAFFQKEGMYLLQDGKYSPMTAVYMACLGMCAELERESISYRLNTGRQMAISKGIKMGRKAGSTESLDQKIKKYPEVVKKLRNGEKMTDIAAWCKGKGLKISYCTIKRLSAAIKKA